MDKNIAALLRQDCKTIKVRFFKDPYKQNGNPTEEVFDIETLLGPDATGNELSPQQYTYVTDLDIKEGDVVVVYARSLLHVVYVSKVDDEAVIKPNDTTYYKWVVCKVDLTSYMQNIEKNKIIQKTCSDAYKRNTRKQFAQLLLAEMDEDSRNNLLTLIDKKGSSNEEASS